MSEIRGNLLVYLRLAGRPGPGDLAVIGEAFGKITAALGITHGGFEVDSAGKTARIRAGDVTGLTDVDSPVATSWTPGLLSVEIRQHPGGPGGARGEAEQMARRLADAAGCQVGPPRRMKSKRHMAVQATWPVDLRLPVLAITADFTPSGGE